MTNVRDALIIDGVRTPRGKGRASGALHHLHPQDLLGQCLTALVERNGFDPSEVDDVIMGNGNSVGDHNADIARLAVLDCGWPVEAPGLTINRFCGSGQQAVSLAAMGIRAGFQELVVAGGVESMSRWPADQTPLLIDGDNPHLRERYPMVPQGISADAIAALEGFSRTDCDELAVASQERGGQGHRRGTVRSQHDRRAQPRRHGCPRPRGAPAAGNDPRGPGQRSLPSFQAHGQPRSSPAWTAPSTP